MSKSSLIRSIQNYTSTFENEELNKSELLGLLEDEDCFLRSRLAGHLTASCWVLDGSGKVLLMHHKKLDKWLQPGGHADGDEDLLNVAKKELNEETGLVHFKANNEIFDLDIHTIPQKKDIPEHLHYDVRFLFISTNPEEIQKNHESIDLRWIKLEEVEDFYNREESITRMVQKSLE
ncbi:MAG: NUDIX hydrolase [Cytophagales bacterium]|nr:NUDIX hydrolase [Cytophagales bacterium]